MTVYEISEETNRLSKDILDSAFYVHTHLGPGLLEKVYEESLAHVLRQRGFQIDQQKVLPVQFDTIKIDAGFRPDLIVNDQIIIELKACERILPIHEAQIHTYLKLSQKTLGLILNFNVPSLKNGIKRIAMAQNKKENVV